MSEMIGQMSESFLATEAAQYRHLSAGCLGRSVQRAVISRACQHCALSLPLAARSGLMGR